MKSLSSFCVLLWLIPYFGKQYFPDVFSMWYIQWTSFGLLSILLPYGFAKSVKNEAERDFATGFLFIFLINIFLTGVGLNLLNSAQTFVAIQTEPVPENISLQAIENINPEVRSVIARVIYKEFGQSIMFKNKSEQLVVYAPTNDDKEFYRQKFLTAEKAKDIFENTKRQIAEILYLFGFACCSFIAIFGLTFRLEQSKANKRIKCGR